jgi:hypothetical protein
MPMATYPVFRKGVCRRCGPRTLTQVTSCSLSSLLPQHHISLVGLGTRQEECRPPVCTDDITNASSIVGQPPSNFDDIDEGDSRVNEDDPEGDLRAIWSKAGCDEFGIILQDGIDESKALLFEGEGTPVTYHPCSEERLPVPELHPPTLHKPWEQLPKNLMSLLSSLGMVKGIRSLNLELSWVYVTPKYFRVPKLTLLPSPFKYGSNVPTNEEVSRVSDGILGNLTILIGQNPSHENEVRGLLTDLVSCVPSELTSDLAFAENTHPEDFVVAGILSNDSIGPHQLVLTREERQRIYRTGADLSGQFLQDPLHRPEGLTSAELERVEPKGHEDEDEEGFGPAPAKKRRLGDFSSTVDHGLESFLPPPDTPHHAIPLPMTSITSSRQAELLNDSLVSRPLPDPQKPQVPLIATSQPRDLIQPNLSDTAHQSVRSVTGIEPSLAPTTGRKRDFDQFLALRGVCLDEPPAATTIETVTDNHRAIEVPPVSQPATTEIPPELMDGVTIQVPAANSLPVSRHQYLASLDLLQKHALCKCLSDDPAAIDLVEREFLGGVDLILDQDTAILFLPLSTLPSECEGLIVGICNISWRYSYILVIFEAFLISQAFGEDNRLASFVFTEPILKSIKKLKRSLLIADGVGTKTEDCVVSFAFAKNIEEAARLARVYGEMAESRDKTGGLLWQERWWLGERESEDSPLFEFEVRPASSPQISLRLIEHPGRK